MWHERIGSLLPNRWKFQWRYWRRQTPWDTQVTPPEVMDFIARTPPGKALDLGCGTGTNAITLSRAGWRVTGVDFIPKAILAARAKAARSGFAIDFLVASVTDLSALSGPFDYALNIGCLHALLPEVTDIDVGIPDSRRLLRRDKVYGSCAVRSDKEIAGLVLPEGGDLVRGVRQQGVLPHRAGSL